MWNGFELIKLSTDSGVVFAVHGIIHHHGSAGNAVMRNVSVLATSIVALRLAYVQASVVAYHPVLDTTGCLNL